MLSHLLQQPGRCHLLAEVVGGVHRQPEVAVHQRQEGQGLGQALELSLLWGPPASAPRHACPAWVRGWETWAPGTHQGLVVRPGDGDQPLLPGLAGAWGLLDADVHDFGEVAEGLEGLDSEWGDGVEGLWGPNCPKNPVEPGTCGPSQTPGPLPATLDPKSVPCPPTLSRHAHFCGPTAKVHPTLGAPFPVLSLPYPAFPYLTLALSLPRGPSMTGPLTTHPPWPRHTLLHPPRPNCTTKTTPIQ